MKGSSFHNPVIPRISKYSKYLGHCSMHINTASLLLRKSISSTNQPPVHFSFAQNNSHVGLLYNYCHEQSTPKNMGIGYERMHGTASEVEPSTIMFHIWHSRTLNTSLTAYFCTANPITISPLVAIIMTCRSLKSYLQRHCSIAAWQLFPWCIHCYISPHGVFLIGNCTMRCQ